MSTLVAPVSPAGQPRRPLGLLRDLGGPGDVLRFLGPNWFATIMGTGIVANAAASLPEQFPGLRGTAVAIWALDAVLLVALSLAWAMHWMFFPKNAKADLDNPVMTHFHGAVPMALMTVGAGSVLVGRDVIGLHTALVVDSVLWSAGTLLGLTTFVLIPYRMITRHRYAADGAFGGWLMPVVPPMVSAATGALLIPHLHGTPAQTLLVACYAMFGMSLFAALSIITMLWSKLMHHGPGPAAATPTLLIVLGPLGQSVTAAGLLAGVAPRILSAPNAAATGSFALLYGVVTWGFALIWLILAAAIIAHTARTSGLPFSMTWWSATFPLGTVVTGTSVLAARTHLPLFQWTAVALYALLAVIWLTVATRTALGSWHGTLFRAPAPAPATPVRETAILGR
jgi:C4-dicarboxylate transporter/malic acid transport protein